jgi:predicted HTH transcriptional regulator
LQLARVKTKNLRRSRFTKQATFLKKYDIPEKTKQALEVPDEKYYLTPKGIAENLGLSYQTVMKQLRLASKSEASEGLKHRRKGPRYVVSEEDFEEWYGRYIG